MEFKDEKPLANKVEREGGEDILYINYKNMPYSPTLEIPEVMDKTIDAIIENPSITRIVLVQQKNYNYDSKETKYLREIADLYVFFIKQDKILSHQKLVTNCEQYFPKRYNDLFSFLITLKSDPIAAYSDIKSLIINGKILLNKISQNCKRDQESYIHQLEKIKSHLEKTELIKDSQKHMKNYHRGNRNIYNILFKPDIIPNFTFTRLVQDIPEDVEIMDQYEISENDYDKTGVTILKKKNESTTIYHLDPPENSLSEDYEELMNLARGVLIEHQPKAEEFTDTDRIRQVFFNIAKDLLKDLAESKNIPLNYNDLNTLATILVRHTIGFGLIEVLLQDPNLQDIVLNAPISKNPVFIRHQEFDECSSNIRPSKEDADSWAAKFRMISGRPLDEANPILDTQLDIGMMRARISIIQEPLSPNGLAYAIRRHRESPWTLPLFIKNKTINSFAAGLLSFLVDGSRTMLVAGTRSSGKCVDGDTLIQLSNGEITKIRELKGKFKRKIDDGKVFNPSKEENVLSLDRNKCSIKKKRITDVWERETPKKLFKITTASGKEIITTPEHPYFTYDSSIKQKRADTLSKRELIATPRKITVDSSMQEIKLKNTSIKKNLVRETKDNYFLKGKTNSNEIKFPKKMTSEMAEFIGMVLGDGHLNSKTLGFSNNCKKLRERYISFLELFNVNYKVLKDHESKVVKTSSRILSKMLGEVFEIPLGKKSDIIEIPKIILKSNNEIVSKFLRGYFDCNGYVPDKKRDIELVTASRKMSEMLRMALLRFGIVIFSKKKNINGITCYRNNIRGEFATEFLKKIGFFHPEKKKRAEESISNKISKKIQNAKILASSDIFWDRVKSIEKISPKEKVVYDLSVKDNHSFVANGIIAHNSSILGSLMLEIMRKFRVIVIEDTLELPVKSLRNLNYDILRMKVRSALSHSNSEISADDGIRTSLRLGDSCLIIGEVRSSEAKALYEAMRVGALANVVAGTIHGASPYAVFDRVVNDLEVPATSFKATDIIVVANVVKSPDGLESYRRVVKISEVRKHWKEDPLEEGGFIDLMKYNVETDELEPTEDLINGDSEIIKDIASNVKGWAGNWDAVYDNILLRGEMKKYLVEAAEKFKNKEILEAEFTKKSNEYFHLISERIRQQYGLPWKKYVFPEWKKTIDDEIKKNYS